ncbi:sulfatase-like hydrolase/transferase [Saltatorellus ferox]|uniref:sulfatase-like hydrolase/transferase n=1 Tax=Saltatorellus ferox TaxID=2528018 RepID=UPI003AF364A6
MASRRPNVLIILADDLRYDGLSATGNPWIQTPALDRIAQEGVLFERSYVTTSRCCPARASFLTGRYAHVHGVLTNKPKTDFHKSFSTYPEELHEAGYRTGYIGKWHILARGQESGPRPGFDRWVSYEGPGSHFDQEFNVDGETVPSKGFQADRLADYALEFLDEQPDDEPFLLTVAFKNPHVPMTPAPRHRGLLDAAAIELPESAYDPVDSLPFFYRRIRSNTDRNHAIESAAAYVEETRRYWELVLSIDDNVARILAKLEEKGELDTTVVIVTADNGQLLGEHGVQQKGISYEPSIRIPFALRYPPITKGGGTTESIALNVDLFPTLMDLCSIPSPPPSDGMSLVPVLEHPESVVRDTFLYAGPQWNNGEMEETAVIDGDLKLIRFVAADGAQDVLFDRAKDPEERRDVIHDPAYAEDVRRMRAFLESESERLGL